ncbi:response regulator [Candidatus Dependentiae bacterium]|nr:response regulator [Candidatus Dependentiae bacterium]
MRNQVLVVDDESFMRDALHQVLSLENYDIFEAENGKSAIDLFETHEFDLVITDVLMPVCDGITLFKKIRENFPETKIIFITAYVAKNSEMKLASLNPDGYIYKPFTINDILRICRTSLTNSGG